MTELADDLAAMAEDELGRALTLSWRELARIVPWGDAFDGFTPAGRQVTVERGYLWAGAAGGDILCEVTVYGGPSRWDEGSRISRVIRPEANQASTNKASANQAPANQAPVKKAG